MNMYRYVGCGLPNVYLTNGYEIVKTPYGEGITIHDIDGLHDAIGSAIINSPSPLSGYEFRFLRNELDLSQAALGKILGCNEQSVARWEKGKSKQVNSVAERFLRVIYQERKNTKLQGLIEKLQHIERIPKSDRSG